MSGFRDTGVPEHEGQHLQSVYPTARTYGGPGRFGFDPRAHLTERSELVSDDSRRRLFAEWGTHWDLSKEILVEKSPPNLIRTRFLQALFPGACFVVLMRHPVAVAYATQKWSRTPISSLIEHWLLCHELFEADRSLLARVLVLRYEDLVRAPQDAMNGVYAFIGAKNHSIGTEVKAAVNEKYLKKWQRSEDRFSNNGLNASAILDQFGERLAKFGYDIDLPGETSAVSL